MTVGRSSASESTLVVAHLKLHISYSAVCLGLPRLFDASVARSVFARERLYSSCSPWPLQLVALESVASASSTKLSQRDTRVVISVVIRVTAFDVRRNDEVFPDLD